MEHNSETQPNEIKPKIYSRRKFKRMVDRLPEDQQQPFKKTYYDQIAEILGSPVHRAKKKRVRRKPE